MNTKHSLFRNPSCLLYNKTLSYSARWVGAALYSRRNRLGQCTISLDALAALANCSIPTARKATEELKRAGCIHFCRSYQYQEKIGRVGYGKTTYACLLPVTKNYTLIPREIFKWKLSHGTLCVCLCLLQQAGNDKKAFPSIRSIAKLLEMGCSTVCRALGAIRKLYGVIVLRCKNHNRTFNRNSYYLRVEYKGAVQTSGADSVPHKRDSCSFFFSNSTAVHSQTQSILDHGCVPIFYRQLRDLDNVGSYKRRKNYRACKLAKSNNPILIFKRESRSGKKGDPPQRGERGEVTFSVSRPSRPALFGSPLSLPICKHERMNIHSIHFKLFPPQTIVLSQTRGNAPVPESGRCSDPLPHRHSHKLPAERPEHDPPGTCGFRQTQSSGDGACLRPQTERSPGHTFSFVPSRITPQKSRQDAPCGHPWG